MSLLCIAGESRAGKDTVANLLCDRHGLRLVCSYTTRPKRANEVDGREHYFITAKQMELLKAAGPFAYTRIGPYEYCTMREDVDNSDIYIIDPAGIEYLIQNAPELSIQIIYITCDEQTRLARAAERMEDSSVFYARCAAEREQFDGFVKKADIVVYNNGTIEEALSQVEEFLWGD